MTSGRPDKPRVEIHPILFELAAAVCSENTINSRSEDWHKKESLARRRASPLGANRDAIGFAPQRPTKYLLVVYMCIYQQSMGMSHWLHTSSTITIGPIVNSVLCRQLMSNVQITKKALVWHTVYGVLRQIRTHKHTGYSSIHKLIYVFTYQVLLLVRASYKRGAQNMWHRAVQADWAYW